MACLPISQVQRSLMRRRLVNYDFSTPLTCHPQFAVIRILIQSSLRTMSTHGYRRWRWNPTGKQQRSLAPPYTTCPRSQSRQRSRPYNTLLALTFMRTHLLSSIPAASTCSTIHVSLIVKDTSRTHLIPLLCETCNLSILNLENGAGSPLCMIPCRLDPIMRLTTMRAFGRVSEQDMRVLGKDNVV